MKARFLNIFFSLIVFTYVFSTVGVCVIAHYCGGELEKVSLFSKPTECCDGEDQETDDCCKDDVKHVINQQDFPFYTLIADCKAPVLQFSIFNFEISALDNLKASHSDLTAVNDSDPPDLVQQDIVANSVIRI